MAIDRQDPMLRVLDDLAQLRSRVDQLEWSVVQLVRSHGATWEDIGDLLDISRQAARSRFSKPKPRRNR